MDENWVEMACQAKKGPVPLAFGFGLGGKRAVMNLGFLSGYDCRPHRDMYALACDVLYGGY